MKCKKCGNELVGFVCVGCGQDVDGPGEHSHDGSKVYPKCSCCGKNEDDCDCEASLSEDQ